MVQLLDAESGQVLGTISPAQLQFLIAQLEEEGLEDQDYYIDRASLDWFEEQGAEPALMALLRSALGSREGMDIRWTEG
jgi:processive 1,2-diacylglycerol beta-glucosyltransferase